jgi:hypothetical protein
MLLIAVPARSSGLCFSLVIASVVGGVRIRLPNGTQLAESTPTIILGKNRMEMLITANRDENVRSASRECKDSLKPADV